VYSTVVSIGRFLSVPFVFVCHWPLTAYSSCILRSYSESDAPEFSTLTSEHQVCRILLQWQSVQYPDIRASASTSSEPHTLKTAPKSSPLHSPHVVKALRCHTATRTHPMTSVPLKICRFFLRPSRSITLASPFACPTPHRSLRNFKHRYMHQRITDPTPLSTPAYSAHPLLLGLSPGSISVCQRIAPFRLPRARRCPQHHETPTTCHPSPQLPDLQPPDLQPSVFDPRAPFFSATLPSL
jgi:hypothetical protein